MNIFCDRLKFGSTAALNSRTGQNKGRYPKKDLLLLLSLLFQPNNFLRILKSAKISKAEKETVNQTCPKSILQTIQLIINL
jgi:Fic family protein